jgi:hypothetical protein
LVTPGTVSLVTFCAPTGIVHSKRLQEYLRDEKKDDRMVNSPS